MEPRKRELIENSQNKRTNSLKGILKSKNSGTLNGSSRRQCSENTVRVAVLGGSGVGKTSLITQFLFGRFPASEEYMETIEDLYKHRYTDSSGEVAMDILDTSGSRDYACFRDRVIRHCDAFIILYAIDDKSSYSEMRQLREKVTREKKSTKIPIVIVGNKTDMLEKIFMRKEAIELVVSNWGHEHVTCTATSSKSVTEVFITLKDLIHRAEIPRRAEIQHLSGTLFMKPKDKRNKRDTWVKVL